MFKRQKINVVALIKPYSTGQLGKASINLISYICCLVWDSKILAKDCLKLKVNYICILI